MSPVLTPSNTHAVPIGEWNGVRASESIDFTVRSSFSGRDARSISFHKSTSIGIEFGMVNEKFSRAGFCNRSGFVQDRLPLAYAP